MTDIFFVHPGVTDIDSFLRFTRLEGQIPAGSLRWNDRNPSILFASEMIFYRKDCFKQFTRLYPNSQIKLAWLGEAVHPDYNIFDYAVGFDNQSRNDERFIRIMSPLDMYWRFIPTFKNEIMSPDEALELSRQKKLFCNFLYSNPKAHPKRDRIFYVLNEFKHVDSLGKHLNNVGKPGTGFGGHADECVPIKSSYRFSIACENACFRGYTSEKIFTSLSAHTIPIYWGNPDVAQDVNPECFVNVNDFESEDALIERINELDSCPELWAEMVAKPWLTDAQTAAHEERTRRYFERMKYILSGNAVSLAPQGYHIDLYKKFFFKEGFAFGKKFIVR